VTTPFSGTVCRAYRLGLAMINRHTKFEVSSITCNEDMKGNAKCKNSPLEPPLGVTHGVHLWLDGKRVVNFLLVLIEHFHQLLRLRCCERILVKIVVFERGWVTLSTNLMENGASSTNDCWHQKTRVPGISRGVVCVIPRLAILIHYLRVTNGRTDRHTMTAST